MLAVAIMVAAVMLLPVMPVVLTTRAISVSVDYPSRRWLYNYYMRWSRCIVIRPVTVTVPVSVIITGTHRTAIGTG